MTLFASLGPARRATKIPPIAALREGAVLPGPSCALRTCLRRGHRLAGLALILQGFSGSGSVSQRLLGMGIGALLVFVAVSMLARFVVRPVARALGWPLERLAGTTGRLARENAMRNPARTARTAAALMIGLGLVVFVSVFAQGLKDGFRSAVLGSLRGNVVMQSSTFLPMPACRRGVEADPGHVSPITSDDAASTAMARTSHRQIEPNTFSRVWKPKWVHGSDATYCLRLGRSASSDDLAKGRSSTWGAGSRSRRARAGRPLHPARIYDGTTRRDRVHRARRVRGISANRDPENVFGRRRRGTNPETS